MSLRPRYSLLTLLVLTALIAGGVKLWYGPHHVVEPHPDHAFYKHEYTYTRGWHGERIIDGPVIYRRIPEQLPSFSVKYFRQGVDTNWMHLCFFPSEQSMIIPHINKDAPCPLSKDELDVFHQACAAE